VLKIIAVAVLFLLQTTQPTLQQRVDSATSLLKIAAGNYNIASPLQLVNRKNLTVQCEPGTNIINTRGSAITINNATGITISGCNISGSGWAATITNSSDVNLHNRNSLGSIYIGLSAFVSVLNNTLDNIFGQDNLREINIANNTVNGSVVLHTNTTNAWINQVNITSNVIFAGKPEFCVELGAFTSSTAPVAEQPLNIVVANNNCVVVTDDVYGGYSFSQVNHAIVSGNNYDRNGHKAGLPGIELLGTHFTVTGNHVKGSDISMDGTSDSIVSSNDVSDGGGLFIGVSRPGSNVSGNTISNNHFYHSIRFQCNYKGADCSGNDFNHNYVIGSGTGVGIIIENDAQGSATMYGNSVEANHIKGFSTCFDDSGTSTYFIRNYIAGGCMQNSYKFSNDPTAVVSPL
jgi:hypothetical protein